MHHPLQLFTIGHSNHTAEAFLQLLQQHGITCVADVRSAPYSRYNRQFNREKFAAFLETNGIAYLWLGDSLGGRKRSDEGYMYDEGFTNGLQILLETAAMQCTAMMCSEENPRNCHRHNVICRSMIYSNAYGNVQLTHINYRSRRQHCYGTPATVVLAR